jgi:NSS family neurotransmitter:Na+ symporter
MGTMITYGSYMPDNANIPATATKVALADILVSLLAGLAIFPAVFAFGYEPSVGPSLLFITIPSVFASMPFGGLFTFLFFVLTAVAALGAILSLFEVPVSYLSETRGWTRRKAALLTALIIIALGIPASLSTNLLSSFTIFGMTFFDLCDFISSNILLPGGGIVIALFVGWRWGKQEVLAAVSNHGQLQNQRMTSAMIGMLRVFTPVAIAIVMLDGLGLLGKIFGS